MPPITPEDGQIIADLRSRLLANVAAGRQAWTGFTREELQKGLEILRGGRARMAEAATKGRKAKAEKVGKEVDTSFLAALGLDT